MPRQNGWRPAWPRGAAAAATAALAVTIVTGCTADRAEPDRTAAPSSAAPSSAAPSSAAPAAAAPSGAASAAGQLGDADRVVAPPLPAYPAIPGSSIPAVTAAWAARWKVEVARDEHRVHSARVGFPPAGDDLLLVAVPPVGDTSGAASAVRCAWGHPANGVTTKVLTAVLDGCLAAALLPAERGPVLAWLTRQDYRRYGERQQRFDRFDVVIQPQRDATRVSVVGRI